MRMAANNGNTKALREEQLTDPEGNMDHPPDQLIYSFKLDARSPVCLGCPEASLLGLLAGVTHRAIALNSGRGHPSGVASCDHR